MTNVLKTLVQNTLGKGEVHSSILCGSTTNQALLASRSRTEAQHNARTRTTIREKGVKFVRVVFA
jgi:hypothetical protein